MNVELEGQETAPRRGLTGRRTIGILAAYVATQLLVTLAILVPFGIYYAKTDPTHIARHSQDPAVLLPAGLVGVIISGWVVLRMTRYSLAGVPHADAARLLGLSWGSREDRIRCALLGLACAMLFILISTTLLPPEPGQVTGPLSQAAESGGWLRALLSVFAVFVAPPVEEFVFRGVLFAGFAASWGRYVSAALVSVIFVLFHLGEAFQYWPALAFIALLAAALVAIRMRTGAIGPTVTLHAAYNLGLVVATYVMS